MIRAGLAGGLCLAGSVALAELHGEEHVLGEVVVRVEVADLMETLTVGPAGSAGVQVLSGADIDIVAFAADPDSVGLLGEPVIVATVFGSYSCDQGDALEYYVVRLRAVPVAEGPVAACGGMAVTVTSGELLLEADPMSGTGEAWVWRPGTGFVAAPG